ncbi:MAG: hypothetical protein F6K50_18540 [Moorea sp. SIO3I7]|nr:hypothetical protein [Moorena sp. SIO3I7]NEO06011.1 hypothetical protein [Moorena sp. SIO3I8]
MKHWQDAISTHIDTGKMPVLPRCQFYQDASSTKMPVLPKMKYMKLARCQFHISKEMKLARCQFY